MKDIEKPEATRLRGCWRAGQIAQALIMSILLFRAMLGLIEFADNAGIFRYQGY